MPSSLTKSPKQKQDPECAPTAKKRDGVQSDDLRGAFSPDTKNDEIFLKTIFLECPLCGMPCYIYDFRGDNFKVKCDSHKWKVSFDIREL